MDNSVIAKSGWLYRKGLTTNWEKNWVELYRDGYLKYYESDESPNAEEVIFMPTECIAIKTGAQVKADGVIKPPDNHSHQCIFSVTAAGNKLWIFCGESLDDMRAWQLALEQSRLLITRNHFANSHLAGPQLNNQLLRSQYSQLPMGGLPPYSPFSLSSNYIPAFTDGSLTFVQPNRASGSTSVNYPNYAPASFASGNPNPSYYPLAAYNSHTLAYLNSHQSSSSSSSVVVPSGGTTAGYQRPDGRDLAMGMLAGAAVGTMMWGPYLWW